jgi:hypothetical protein
MAVGGAGVGLVAGGEAGRSHVLRHLEVHVPLGERDGDPLLVEAQLHLLGDGTSGGVPPSPGPIDDLRVRQ